MNRSSKIDLLQKLLSPLSPLYQGITTFRTVLYDKNVLTSRRLPKPVISVGNLTTGGTGKTPLVIEIVRQLSREGLHLVVLSRGYKGDSKAPVNLVSNTTRLLLDAGSAGDEPCLMARKLPGTPILTGKDRYTAGMEALRHFKIDAFILDDGFQHLPLQRQANLLLLDGKKPFGKEQCLPGGDLREGLSALGRADLIVLAGQPSEEDRSQIKVLAPSATLHSIRFQATGVLHFSTGREEPLSFLEGKRLFAFAGIARPERFYRELEAAGVDLRGRRTFPDHHNFHQEELDSLLKEGRTRKAEGLITTEKDAVRISAFPEELPLYALQLGVTIEDPEFLLREIRRRIGV